LTARRFDCDIRQGLTKRRERADVILTEIVSAREPFDVIVGQVGTACAVLPDQKPERKIDTYCLCRLHQGRTCFWTAEDQEQRGFQKHSHLGGRFRMIHPCDKWYAAGVYGRYDLVGCVLRTEAAESCREALHHHVGVFHIIVSTGLLKRLYRRALGQTAAECL
jgi:hypothetical protein